MNIASIQKIAEEYNLSVYPVNYLKATHIHFMDGAGFYLAIKRVKKYPANRDAKLISEITEKTFREMCKKIQHKPKTKAEAHALFLAQRFQETINRKTCGIPSIRYYPDFRLFTIMSDGFPQARFIFDKTFKNVFFAFSKDQTLQHMRNPNSIPYIFPVKELPEMFKRVTI